MITKMNYKKLTKGDLGPINLGNTLYVKIQNAYNQVIDLTRDIQIVYKHKKYLTCLISRKYILK